MIKKGKEIKLIIKNKERNQEINIIKKKNLFINIHFYVRKKRNIFNKITFKDNYYYYIFLFVYYIYIYIYIYFFFPQ